MYRRPNVLTVVQVTLDGGESLPSWLTVIDADDGGEDVVFLEGIPASKDRDKYYYVAAVWKLVFSHSYWRASRYIINQQSSTDVIKNALF